MQMASKPWSKRSSVEQTSQSSALNLVNSAVILTEHAMTTMVPGMVSKLDMLRQLSRFLSSMVLHGLHGHGAQWLQTTKATSARMSMETELVLVLLIPLMAKVLTGFIFGRPMVVRRPSLRPLSSFSDQLSIH